VAQNGGAAAHRLRLNDGEVSDDEIGTGKITSASRVDLGRLGGVLGS
jgi:hypothetical protein